MTIALEGQSATLELVDSEGTPLALASPAENVDQLIGNFIATSKGTYYARVTAVAQTDYSLIVTRNADFDSEGNDGIEAAQNLISSKAAGRRWALGAIEGTGIDDEGFETGDFSTLPWKTLGNADWFVTDQDANSGTFSARAGDISDSQSSSLEVTVETDAGNVEFARLVSSETSFDFLRFFINGSQVGSWSGIDSSFTQESFPVSAGTNTFRWSFTKDGSVSRGLDTAFIDDIVFPGTNDTSDFYEVDVKGRKMLRVETLVPAQSEGEFVNNLDPMIRVYDSEGNLVAQDDNSARDGLNARLKYKVPRDAGGTYFIEVLASDATAEPTSGEYVLSVKGTTGERPAFEVVGTDLPDGTRTRDVPTSVTVDFNDTLLLSTLDASDLKIDGVPAVGVTVIDADTARFELPPNELTQQTLSFQQGVDGYNGTFDRLIGDPSNPQYVGVGSAVDTTVSSFFIDGDPADPFRKDYLIRFEDILGPNAIPEGATIVDARLNLRTTSFEVTANSRSGESYNVYRLTQPFDENSSFFGDFNNGVPGVEPEDGEADFLVGTFHPQNEYDAEYSANVTRAVQSWLDGDPNFGLAILSDHVVNDDGWSVHSTGSSVPQFRPRLDVTFTTDPLTIQEFQNGLNGYTATQDIVLDSRFPDTNQNGALASELFLDGPGGTSPDRPLLIRFDDLAGGGLNPGDEVLRAELIFTTGFSSGASDSPGPYTVRQMLVPFNEDSGYGDFAGDVGQLEAVGEVGPEVDFFENDPVDGPFIDEAELVRADVTEVVQSWLDGAPNFGLYVGADGTSNGWQIFTSGAIDSDLAPMLRVVTVDEFSPNDRWQATDGPHVISVDTGAVDDVQNTPVEAFSSTFVLDRTAPRVISSSIQDNAVLAPGDLSYEIVFNEELDSSNLDQFDFQLQETLTGQFVSADSFSYDAESSTLSIDYTDLGEGNYVLALFSGDQQFEDLVGNDLDGEVFPGDIPPGQSGNGAEGGNFVLNVTLDIDTSDVPVPLDSVAPSQSLIYQGATPGVINGALDSDSFEINLDAGQTLTVAVNPSSDLVPTVEVRDADGVTVGTASGAAAGEQATLQTVPVPAAGTYTIVVSAQNGATGNYGVDVMLNAALETLVASNDQISAAQDLDASFIPLATGADRGAVLGSVGNSLYAVSRRDNQLRILDPSTGQTLSSQTLTIPGETVFFASYGVANDPTTGVLYGVLATSIAPETLVMIDPETAVATSVGALSIAGRRIREIVFDADGNLYGVTGGRGSDSSSLFRIDKANPASLTELVTFTTRGSGGVALNTDDGLLYRYDDNVFESIDVSTPTPTITRIPTSGSLPFSARGMVYAGAGQFLLTGSDRFYSIDTSGAGTFIDNNDFSRPHGLAFAGDSVDFYSFTLNAGESASLAVTDIDGDLNPGNLGVELLDPDGNVVALPAPPATLVEDFETGFLDSKWTTLSETRLVVRSLAAADALIAGDRPSVSFSGTIDQADLYDPTRGFGAIGNWDFDNVVPGGGGDDYAVQTTGTIQVNQPGTYSFALGSDDGGRLTIGGTPVVTDTTLNPFSDSFGEVTLEAGLHDFEWVGFEAGFAAGFELVVKVGSDLSGPVSTDSGWQVVGDPEPFAEIELVGSMSVTTYYAVSTPTTNGRIQVAGSAGTASGDFALLMDRVPNGPLVQNEAVWTVDVSSFKRPVLSFSHADFDDERFFFPDVFQVSSLAVAPLGDGVLVSDDGDTWYTLLNAPDLDTGVWEQVSFDLSLLPIDLSADIQVKFAQVDNQTLPGDGRGFDEISITEGQSNLDSVIENFVVSNPGTYTVRVTGQQETDYSLLVTRDANISIESNNGFENAQTIGAGSSGQHVVLGAIANSEGRQLALEAFDTGWWDSTGFHFALNTNYFTGFVPEPRELRGFFAFDLPGLASEVVEARLDIFSHLVLTETVEFYDVTTSVDEVTRGGNNRVDIFEDLGNGTVFGSRSVLTTEDNVLLEFDLNDEAVAAVNAAQGQPFAIGSALTTIDPDGPQQNLFGDSLGRLSTQKLVLTLADSDFYQVSVDSGDQLSVETSTPGGGSGEFVNELDPIVRVYDEDGNLVAEDDNSGTGNNAQLSYSVPADEGGTYFVVVSGADTSNGQYVLSVDTDAEIPAVPALVVSSAGKGEMVQSLPTSGSLQNPLLAEDVNNDGFATPSDALLIINAIASGVGQEAATNGLFTDVNGDSMTSAADALRVINFLANVIESRPDGLGTPAQEMDEAVTAMSSPEREIGNLSTGLDQALINIDAGGHDDEDLLRLLAMDQRGQF